MTAHRTAQRPSQHRFRAARSIAALILREMETSYGRSPGGYLWAVLEPVAGIALLSLVFGLIIHVPSLGTNFALFYATGLLPFLMYVHISNHIATSIRFSQALLAYPAVAFADALIARFLLHGLTQVLVMGLLLFGIIFVFDLNPILDWSAILVAIGLTLLLAFAVGTVNCYLFTAFPAWERLWAIVNRPLFLISGIIFVPEDVPAQYRDLVMINPLAHITTIMRKGFYATYDAVYAAPMFVVLCAIVIAVPGLLLLLRTHKDIVLK